MSLALQTAIDNARYLLGAAIPSLADGKFDGVRAHGVAALFRSRGIGELLLYGVSDPLLAAQMQSVSAYLFALQRPEDGDEKVTSLGGCFWDAVSAQYWDAAREIALLSSMSHNPKREHEDDFLYVAFLMQRYLLAPSVDAPVEQVRAHKQAQIQRLERWEQVLEGAVDPRLDLCHALCDRDDSAFADALVSMADQRDKALLSRHKMGALTEEDLAWLLPIWPEGLALLRLAERDGLAVAELAVPRVPPVIRVDNPYIYDPDAWRSIDFRPAKRRA